MWERADKRNANRTPQDANYGRRDYSLESETFTLKDKVSTLNRTNIQ